ncbi:MAG: pitrilysin family protein [Planctomycetota bacterium]
MLAGITVAALAVGSAAPPPQALVRETVTDEGLRIWSFPDDGGDRFLLMVLVGSGSRHEDPPGTGVAHLLEHVLLESTELRSDRELNRALEQRGGTFNGYTTQEVTTYHVECRPDDWEFAVEWLAEHLVTPGFDPDDFASERSIVYEEVRAREPHAGSSTLGEHLYPEHPLGASVGGDKAGIRRLQVADLRTFFAAHYRAPNMAVGFAGRVDADTVTESIRRAFAGLPAGGEVASIDPVEPRTGRKLVGSADRLDRPGWIYAGYHLPAGGARETAMQMLIARYLATRVFEEVREARQLSYGPGARLAQYFDTSRLELHVEVSDARKLPTVREVLDGLSAELGDPDAATLDSAARSAVTAFDASSASDLGDAMELAWRMRRAGSSPSDLQRALARFDPDDVARYAETHLVPERSFTVASAPVGGEGAPLFAVLLGVVLLFVVVDGARGFPVIDSIRRRGVRLPALSRGGETAKPARRPDVIRPVHVDDLERSIQDYFADEDRRDEKR